MHLVDVFDHHLALAAKLIRGAFLSGTGARLSVRRRRRHVESGTGELPYALVGDGDGIDARRLRDSIATGCCCGRGLRDTLRPLRCGEKTLRNWSLGKWATCGAFRTPSLMICYRWGFSRPRTVLLLACGAFRVLLSTTTRQAMCVWPLSLSRVPSRVAAQSAPRTSSLLSTRSTLTSSRRSAGCHPPPPCATHASRRDRLPRR